MKTNTILALMALIGAALVAPQTYAVIVIDPNAPVVELRTSCVEAGVDMNNCFTDRGALYDWIHATRVPSAQKPLLVKIGPGTFGGFGVDCSRVNGYSNIVSNITFRGAGRGRTVLNALPQIGFFGEGGCQDISVEDMTIIGGATAVDWRRGGSSTWTNVELKGRLFAWYDLGNTCVTPGLHKFFATTFSTEPTTGNVVAFLNTCGKVWLWGSEITVNVQSYTGLAGTMGAIESFGADGAGNEMHIYGSSVSVNTPSTAAVTPIVVISARGGAQVHVHGTGIDGIAGNASPVTALSASSGGIIHANETSYNLNTGGAITRIVKDTNIATDIRAPYLWEEHPNAPVITSVDGADMAVVTSTSDGRPHLVIYNNACASKWFDTSTKLCR